MGVEDATTLKDLMQWVEKCKDSSGEFQKAINDVVMQSTGQSTSQSAGLIQVSVNNQYLLQSEDDEGLLMMRQGGVEQVSKEVRQTVKICEVKSGSSDQAVETKKKEIEDKLKKGVQEMYEGAKQKLVSEARSDLQSMQKLFEDEQEKQKTALEAKKRERKK